MILLLTDLHFTDRPQDRYRFDLFLWTKKIIEKYSVSHLFVLGDLTDSKDGHPSKLVNRIVDEFVKITSLCEVVILAGNHDSIDPTTPFFMFLNDIPKLQFISEPTPRTISGKRMWFLPHTRDLKKDWKRIKSKLETASYVFMHQTVNGSIASNGFKLDGIPTSYFRYFKGKIFSGDIHVPQNIGKITYVGSPYSIRFNDTFEPRGVLLTPASRKCKNVYFDTLRKWTLKIREPNDILEYEDIRAGDQVKVLMKIKRHDIVSWSSLRREILNNCDAIGVKVFDVKLQAPKNKTRIKLDDKQKEAVLVEPTQVLLSYCKRQKVHKSIRQAGTRILKGNFNVQISLG